MTGIIFFPSAPTAMTSYFAGGRDYAPRKHAVTQSPTSPQSVPEDDQLVDLSEQPRSSSVASSSDDMWWETDPAARNNSALAAHRTPRRFSNTAARTRTRSIGGAFGAGGVVFERDLPEPTDEDVIMVTVRLKNDFRRSSVEGAESLPSRPPQRNFLRRLSTRLSIDHTAEKEERYKAIKMPRGEYKRHFARDKDGNYAGSEPERHWDEEELLKVYGEYQNVPLHTVLCGCKMCLSEGMRDK